MIIAPFLLLLLALYVLFHRSWRAILTQLTLLGPGWFALALAVSACYYVLDACGFRLLLRRRLLPDFTLREALALIAMGLFMNVSTLGAGIKPAQALYLKERGADVGEGLGLLVLPYLFHKLTIVLWGLTALGLARDFILSRFAQWVPAIYLGCGLSIAICCFLAAIFTSARFHALVFRLLTKLSARPRYQELVSQAERETAGLRRQVRSVIGDGGLCLRMLSLNVGKFACWHTVPYLALYALGQTSLPLSFGQGLAVAALMQLLIGVIPVTGGMVSAEVVFVLLYGVILGPVAAGSAMLVFRLATYYLPVLISALYSLWVYRQERSAKKAAL